MKRVISQAWSRPALRVLTSGILFAAALPNASADQANALARLRTSGLQANPASLVQYAAQGDLATVNLLLAAGVDLKQAEGLRQVTALHNASAQGHLKIVQRLLALGADVHAQDWHGVTPLIAAAQAGHTEIVRLLLQHGAQVNHLPHQAPSALIATIWQADGQRAAKILPLLLSAGARPDQPALGILPMQAAQLAQRPALLAMLTAAMPQAPASASAIVAEIPTEPSAANSAHATTVAKDAKDAKDVKPAYSRQPGQTILEYADLPNGEAARALLIKPSSVFHADQLIDDEAANIISAWQSQSMSMPWTALELSRHVKHKISPTRAARGLALVHVAMHDAYLLAKAQQQEPKLAVSMAAAQVLAYLFPAEEKSFERIAFAVAARLNNRPADALPQPAQQALALGMLVGQHVARYGDTDGAQKGWNGVRLQWYGEGRYYGPGTWQPTPPYFYYPPDEPFAASWRTWALQSASQFRPQPLVFGSPAYLKDLQQVLDVQKRLSPAQLEIAKFWVDGSGSVTPAGHWNQIALEKAQAAKLDDLQSLRLFAHLNIAQADTFIAAWDAKYHYWTVRPITAAKQVLGVDFKPAILTPPFPSYVSGHASFSGAAARIIGAYLPKQAQELQAMAQQAADSRLLGGIHFRHDNEDGLQLGRNVAQQVLRVFAGQE